MLAKVMLKIFNANNEIKIIGTRHGEKKFETLVTREEMQKAVELENYYRIPADNRDLNYQKYFTEGTEKIKEILDYNSDNTLRLGENELEKILLKLDFIKDELKKPERP